MRFFLPRCWKSDEGSSRDQERISNAELAHLEGLKLKGDVIVFGKGSLNQRSEARMITKKNRGRVFM
jgi:hypothetical protein